MLSCFQFCLPLHGTFAFAIVCHIENQNRGRLGSRGTSRKLLCIRNVNNYSLFTITVALPGRVDFEISPKMLPGVKEGDRVLLIWSGIAPPEKLEERVHQLNSVVGPMGKVAIEHEERLKLCEFIIVNVVKLNYVLHCHCSLSLKFENVLGKWLFREFNFTVWKS